MSSSFKAFFQKSRLLVVLLMLFYSGFASPAAAQDNFVSYPLLPPSYSSIRIFDSQERFVGRILTPKRYWVRIDQIPVFLQNALIAIEDERFYEHGGIDVRGVARALVKDVIKGRKAEGGSTITQQLIKNKYLKPDKTIERKVQEGMLAMEYERKYTKKQILEMYFNEIYFGKGAYGIAQASLLYFDKQPHELNEIECVLLAATPKAPNRYNPFGDPKIIWSRKNLILKRMAELKMINSRKEKKLRAEPLPIMKRGEASSYVNHVRYKLIEQNGPNTIEQGGLDVITAMDLPMQRLAEKTLQQGVRRLSPRLQGALLALDPNTGNILAAVGSVDFVKNQYDRAFFAKRQPGSSIKPLIYAAALEKGYTAGTIASDAPITFDVGNGDTWTPRNYENKHYGDLSLRQALALSNNVITAKLLDAVGGQDFVDFAARMGLILRMPNNLSLALGTEEVTLHDLISAYVPLANGGRWVQSRTLLRVYDRNRKAWTETPTAIAPVISPEVAYVTTDMLKDVLKYGTAWTLKGFAAKRPAAGKTGTTDDYRDAWFIGYTPQIVAGVWVGHDKPQPGGKGFTGGGICAPIWKTFMEGALAGKPVVDFVKPDSVLSVLIDPTTNDLATNICPTKKEELYIAGTQPVMPCPKHNGMPLEAPLAMPVP